MEADPDAEDFFRQVIELRKSLPDDDPTGEFLKVLADSASYGIFSEMNRQDSARKPTDVEVHGLDTEPFAARVVGPEEPGWYCFPSFVAFIAGAARLMLALLERRVTDLDGTYTMGDTDSMAIVATEQRGLVSCPGGSGLLPDRTEAIRALSWAKVEALRQRFARLNPHDLAKIGGSVLRLEDDNLDAKGEQRQLWCHAISAKRYCLYTIDAQGELELVTWSEHGLGHLLNPLDPDCDDRHWMRQVWEGIVREALSLLVEEPAWSPARHSRSSRSRARSCSPRSPSLTPGSRGRTG